MKKFKRPNHVTIPLPHMNKGVMSNVMPPAIIMNAGQPFVKNQDFSINIIFLKVIPKYYIDWSLKP